MSFMDKSLLALDNDAIGIPVSMDALLPIVLKNYQRKVITTDDPNIKSNYDIIEWVLRGGIREEKYIETFHRSSFNSTRMLNIQDVIAFVIYTQLFGSHTQKINATGDVSLLRKISDTVIDPLSEMLSDNPSFIAKVRVFDEYHIKAIRHELSNGNCKKYGSRYYFWLDFSMDPQYDAAGTQEVWYDIDVFSLPEVRASAINGFFKIFDLAAAHPVEDYYAALDWFIDQAHIFDYENACRRLMKNLYQRKDGAQNVRDYLLGYYEHRRAFFNQQFVICSEYEFIDRCHYEEYEIIDDLIRRVDISMQDYAEIHEFFPAGKIERGRDVEYVARAKRKLRDPKAYRTLIFEALSEAFSHIQRTALPLADSPDEKPTVINIYPNRIKEDNEARPLGDYIALKFKYGKQWWILVDSLKPDNAIYLWHGERYTDGIEIFTQAKMTARSRQGVYHRNHTFNTRSAFDSYRLILSDAGCASVLE